MQAQPHDNRNETLRAGTGVPQKQQTFKDAHAHNYWRQTAPGILETPGMKPD